VTGDKCVFSICCPLVTRTCANTRVYSLSLSVCNVPPTTIDRSIDWSIDRIYALHMIAAPRIGSTCVLRRFRQKCIVVVTYERAYVHACVRAHVLIIHVSPHRRRRPSALLTATRTPCSIGSRIKKKTTLSRMMDESQQQKIRRLTTMFRIKLKSNDSITIFYNLWEQTNFFSLEISFDFFFNDCIMNALSPLAFYQRIVKTVRTMLCYEK